MISIHALLAESDRYNNFYPQPKGISIHALLAESDSVLCYFRVYADLISIHALLAESDADKAEDKRVKAISIHALLAESDSKPRRLKSRRCVFLSTLSLRRATYHRILLPRSANYFYPRSPCGERPIIQEIAVLTIAFLSTLSLRRATNQHISSDFWERYFYPRSPCGERPVTTVVVGPSSDFYPRSPCGERPRQNQNL